MEYVTELQRSLIPNPNSSQNERCPVICPQGFSSALFLSLYFCMAGDGGLPWSPDTLHQGGWARSVTALTSPWLVSAISSLWITLRVRSRGSGTFLQSSHFIISGRMTGYLPHRITIKPYARSLKAHCRLLMLSTADNVRNVCLQVQSAKSEMFLPSSRGCHAHNIPHLWFP